MKNVAFKIIALTALISIWAFPTHAQNKVSITSTNPSNIHLCADAEWFELDVRNITTSSLSGLTAIVNLPTGMEYISGSVSGTGVSESNVSNLQKPEFSLPTLSLASSAGFKIKVQANCAMISFLSGGGLPRIQTEVKYSGGSTKQTSSPLTILQPSVKIASVTNQFATVDLGSIVTRVITITNGGKGKLPAVLFRQIHQKGIILQGFEGGTKTQSGDTVWSAFNKAHFTTIGNKDSFLSQGESVVIHDTLFVKECSNLRGFYNLTWGCNGAICTSDNASSNLTISTKSPKLTFTTKSATTTCFAASTPHLQELIIKNDGNDTARDVVLDILQSANSGYYQYVFSQLDVGNVEISIGGAAFKKITPTKTVGTHNSGNWSCLGTGAVGAMDLDLPDIPPNQTVHLRWYSISCCPVGCDAGFYAHRWKYAAEYKNQCGSKLVQAESWGSTGLYQSYSMTSNTPSDIINGQTKELNFQVTNGRLLAPTSSARMTVRLILPKGVSHSKSGTHFFYQNTNGNTWKPNSITQKGDTINALFIGAPSFNLVRSELRIFITGTCNNLNSNSDLDFDVDIFYNPNPSCKDACDFHIYCFNSSIRVHCDQSCSSGLKFADFDARRITYGDPDNNNDGVPDATGTLDMSKIKLERVMVGDTLLTTFRGKINRVGSITNWRYLNASSVINYGKFLKVADVRLKIYRVGNLLYDCNGISHSYTTSGNSRTFNFDVGVSALISAKCPLFSGFTFGVRDSVELEVRYVYDTNPGNFTSEVTIDNLMYLSTVANPNPSQRYQCDTFGGSFTMVGYYFTNYGKGTYTTNSCNEFEVSQNYYLSVGRCCSNYAGGNMFPYEYRNWANIKEAQLILPKGFEVVNCRLYQYRTTGTGSTQYQYVDTVRPYRSNGDTTFYNLDTLHTHKGGNLILSDDGFHAVVYYKLRANCNAEQGTSDIFYNYLFKGNNYLNGVDELVPSYASSDLVVYDKPYVQLNVEQNDVKAKSDTAEWNIRLQNRSSVSNAEYVWISYQSNGNTRITEIKDRVTGQIIVPNNDIFRLGQLKASATRELLIRAVYDNCDPDSFPLVTGYNCTGYPDSLADYPCAPVVQYLSYTPVNTRLSATIADSLAPVDLCDEATYSIEITNEGEARVFNMYLDVVLREGMILNDTAWGFEPGTSDSFRVTGYTFVGNNTYRFYISSSSNGVGKKGLPGFTSSLPNNLKFKFKLNTDCNFVSSSYFLVRPGGELNCGIPVNSTFGVGKPINIKNIKKPYFSSVSLDMDKPDVCNYNGKIRIKFINLGPDTTSTQDKIQLLLPDGIYVDTNYLTSIYNGPVGKTTISRKGQYKAEFNLPPNTVPGDSSYFEINTFVVSSEIPCGYTQIVGQAIVKQPALCVKDSSICDIDVATSSELILDSIQKSIYELTFNSGISYPKGNREDVSLEYTVTNTGSVKLATTPLVVKIIDDKNQNGRLDAGEALLGTDTILMRMDRNSSLTRQVSMLLLPAQTCKISLLIDSLNCACDQTFITVPPIRVVNAGRDTTLCPLTDVWIGTPSLPGCTYAWNPSTGVLNPDSAHTLFNRTNLTPNDQTYRLILETNKGSCSTIDTTEITLFPAMQLDLPDKYRVCRRDSIIVGELVPGGKGFKSYQWSPNYNIHNDKSVKVWAKPDTSTQYTIVVTDSRGCQVTDSTLVQVVEKPIASFTVTDTCTGALFSFKSNSTPGNVGLDSGFWDFGYLGRFVGLEHAMFIDSTHMIDVNFRVQDSIGCSDDTTISVTSFPLPVSLFSAHDDCAEDTFEFLNLGTIQYGSFQSKWRINGDSASTTNLISNLQNPGDYIVELVLTSDRNCKDYHSDTITIHPKPDLSIQTRDECLNEESVFSFTNSTFADTLKISWVTSNGIQSSDSTIRFRAADTGTINADLIVESRFGCSDTASASQFIHPNPVADISILDICEGDSTFVRSTSTIAKGNIVSYQFELGNGWQTLPDSFKYKYSAAGTYSISHIATSDQGCSDTTWGLATVYPKDITGVTVTGNCQFEVINFSSIPQNPDSIISMQWKINSIDSFNTSNHNHRFNNSGIHQIELKSVTNHGCTYDTTFTKQVDPKPNAAFDIILPCNDNNIEVNSTSSVSTGVISQTLWNFGDGTNKQGGNMSHTYDSVKQYDIRLIVNTIDGCQDTLVQQVDIPTIVIPDFDLTNACTLDSALFEHKSVGLISGAYFWFNLGDGNESHNQQIFRHAYRSSGTYPVKLTVSTAANCTYDTIKNIEIHPLPIPGFAIDPPVTDILNSDITVIDESSGASDYRYWLSDQSIYTQPNFSHHFSDSGTFVIRQILTNTYGCVDSFERTVKINYLVNILLPNAFTPNGDGKNDLFGPGGLGVVDYDLAIFNRWGEMIYHSDSGVPWDGQDALPGVYYYSLTMKDFNGKPHYASGTVNLVR